MREMGEKVRNLEKGARIRVAHGLGVYGIQGLFNSGIRYTSAEMCRYTTNFGYTIFGASINFGYIGRNHGCLGVFWRIVFGYTTGLPDYVCVVTARPYEYLFVFNNCYCKYVSFLKSAYMLCICNKTNYKDFRIL